MRSPLLYVCMYMLPNPSRVRLASEPSQCNRVEEAGEGCSPAGWEQRSAVAFLESSLVFLEAICPR
jgi:hypothetical protein